jgi:hypothetical protein
VDVPGSNCTKKLISEILPGFHQSSGGAYHHTRRPVTTKNRSWKF